MRILVVGAGALGGYFGTCLARAGRDVDFLVRPARAELLREHGLRVRDLEGRVDSTPVSAVTADRLGADYDLVVLAVKAYALDAAVKDLAPAVGPHTVVVPFLNGMRHVDVLTERFGADRVYGGVGLVQTRLGAEGEVERVGDLAELVYGPLSDTPVQTLERVHAALDGAGFTATATEEILQRMWEKWVFLATMGACNCLMRGPIGSINRAPGGAEFTAAMTEEAVAIATAAGHPPGEGFLRWARSAISSTTSTTSTSMYWDLTHGNPVEADHIVGDLVRRAHDLGVPAPLFSLARTHLSVYSAGRDA
ncbi:ketopantoate reductase family protein [Nocardiopsis lucentensis]|uniref:ketopantoate reductase family protein n=1 Tax=Nocardiopsis lucentensis TaxID=53441 RepID=UPI0003475F0C|nr:ketopantoate reductase family protein [Nocardiopsis lucentensis]